MKHAFFILLLAVIVALPGCLPHYVLFSVNNQSSKQIYYSYATSYPDTSINIGYIKPGSTATPSVLLGPGQQFTMSAPSSLDDYFASLIPSDTLLVFIYDAKVVMTTPWDSIVNNYIILKRYELSIDNIKKMKNVIVYP
jgi:hypothetical protein